MNKEHLVPEALEGTARRNRHTVVPAAEGMIVKLEEEPTLDEALFMIQVINPVFDYRIDGDTVTITKRK